MDLKNKTSRPKGWAIAGAFVFFVLGGAVAHAEDVSAARRSTNIEDQRDDPEFAKNRLLQISNAVNGKANDFWFNGYFVRSGFSACANPTTKKIFSKFGDLYGSDDKNAMLSFLSTLKDSLKVDSLQGPCFKYFSNFRTLLDSYAGHLISPDQKSQQLPRGQSAAPARSSATGVAR